MAIRSRMVLLALVLVVLSAIPIVSDQVEAAQPSNKCQYPNLNYGFYRNEGGQNWCTIDGAATEWMKWNYYPGTPGFNNPFFGGPYVSNMFNSMSAWTSVSSKLRLTYSSGYWIDNVDAFAWAEEFDVRHPGYAGWVDNFWCVNQSSCSQVTIQETNGIGIYNLSYVYFDDDGLPFPDGITAHELGHAMGLVHGNNPGTCPAPARVMHSGCVSSGTLSGPTSADGTDLTGMYLP